MEKSSRRAKAVLRGSGVPGMDLGGARQSKKVIKNTKKHKETQRNTKLRDKTFNAEWVKAGKGR